MSWGSGSPLGWAGFLVENGLEVLLVGGVERPGKKGPAFPQQRKEAGVCQGRKHEAERA